jgi:hypothetical protein
MKRFVRNNSLFASTFFKSILYPPAPRAHSGRLCSCGLCASHAVIHTAARRPPSLPIIDANATVCCARYHPDESQLLTTGSDRKITYWDAYDGSAIRILDGSQSAELNSLAVTASGDAFVSAGADKVVKVRSTSLALASCIGWRGPPTRRRRTSAQPPRVLVALRVLRPQAHVLLRAIAQRIDRPSVCGAKRTFLIRLAGFAYARRCGGTMRARHSTKGSAIRASSTASGSVPTSRRSFLSVSCDQEHSLLGPNEPGAAGSVALAHRWK